MARRPNLTPDDASAAVTAGLSTPARERAGASLNPPLLGSAEGAERPDGSTANAIDLGAFLGAIPGAEAAHRQGLRDLAAARVQSLDDL